MPIRTTRCILYDYLPLPRYGDNMDFFSCEPPACVAKNGQITEVNNPRIVPNLRSEQQIARNREKYRKLPLVPWCLTWTWAWCEGSATEHEGREQIGEKTGGGEAKKRRRIYVVLCGIVLLHCSTNSTRERKDSYYNKVPVVTLSHHVSPTIIVRLCEPCCAYCSYDCKDYRVRL